MAPASVRPVVTSPKPATGMLAGNSAHGAVDAAPMPLRAQYAARS